MVYELLSGKPVFPVESPTDAAFAHAAQKPEPPSAKAPRGWVGKELDEWVLSLLASYPSQRPRDAQALLDVLDASGAAPRRAAAARLPLPTSRRSSRH